MKFMNEQQCNRNHCTFIHTKWTIQSNIRSLIHIQGAARTDTRVTSNWRRRKCVSYHHEVGVGVVTVEPTGSNLGRVDRRQVRHLSREEQGAYDT